MENTGEIPQSPAEVNKDQLSIETASNKLAVLQDPNFKDFAVRFMGIREYKDIFEKEILTGEVQIFGKERAWRLMSEKVWQPSFKEYVQEAQKRQHGWEDVAYDQTNWPEANLDMTIYSKLIDELKKAHREASGNPDKRTTVLEKFRENVTPWIDSWDIIPLQSALENYRELKDIASVDYPDVSMKDFVNEFDKIDSSKKKQGVFQQFFPNASDTLKQQYKYLESKLEETRTDAGSLTVIDEFLSDEDYLTKDKGNLRKVINAIAYGPKLLRQSHQFHLALILDIKDAAIGGTGLHRDWAGIGGPHNPDFKKEGAILGAIATMPDKEMLQEMMALSSHSGGIAHPIFDAQGVVRWPRGEER